MVNRINTLIDLPELYTAKPLSWPALYALLLVVALGTYLPFDQANFWLGLIGIGLYARYPVSEKGSNRFFIASLVLLIIYYFFTGTNLILFCIGLCTTIFIGSSNRKVAGCGNSGCISHEPGSKLCRRSF